MNSQDILDLVDFDQALRAFLFDALAAFEIQFRSILAFHSATGSPYIYIDGQGLSPEFKTSNQVQSESRHTVWLRGYERSVSRRIMNTPPSESNFNRLQPLTIWEAVEVLEFGQIASLYRALDEPLASRIAYEYSASASFLKSAVATLNDLRNHVVHHSRIWDFHYPISPMVRVSKLSRELQHLRLASDYERHKQFTRLSILLWINSQVELSPDFAAQMKTLFRRLPWNTEIVLDQMGFTTPFRQAPMWSALALDLNLH